ncbi:MAG: ArnT family glycosyltransferase [Candidatus Hydrothermarchaeales archaeon]
MRFYFILNIPVTNADGIYYSWIGLNLVEGYGFSIAEGESLFTIGNVRMPLFPLTLSLFYKVLGTGFIVSKIPSLIFGLLIIPLVYLIAEQIFDREAAILAALLISFNPLLSFYSTEIMSEGIYTFFLMLFLYFLISNKDAKYAKMAGVIAGLSYLMKMTGMGLALVGIVYYAFVLRKKFVRHSLEFLIVFILLSFPWLLWCNYEYGTLFVPEKSTASYQYELEYGEEPSTKLGMATYLLDYHTTRELYSGFKDGAKKLTKSLLTNSFFGYSGVLEQEETTGRLKAISRYLILLGLVPFLIGVIVEKRMGRGIDVAFGGIIFLGLIAPAWQMHVISWPEERYVVPLLSITLIYLAGGLSRIYHWRRPLAIIFALGFMASFLHTSFGLIAIEHANTKIGYYYASSDIDLPKDSVIIASNTEKVRDLGYSKVYPLSDRNFDGILELAKKIGAEYLIIDSSSISNQDQILLVTHWYSKKVPKEFLRIGGRRYKPTSYKIRFS